MMPLPYYMQAFHYVSKASFPLGYPCSPGDLDGGMWRPVPAYVWARISIRECVHDVLNICKPYA